LPLLTVLYNPDKLDFNFKIDRPLALPAYRVVRDEIYWMDKDHINEVLSSSNE
jgi:hypothetical protein